MKTVVCSHGFGVDATSRGMFTDIAAAFPGIKFVMFDYNTVDASGNMTVRSLPEQAALLNEQLAKVGGQATLLCHSMGCAVASLADLANVNDVIFLAPPSQDSFSKAHFADKFGSRPGAVWNPDGVSTFPRRDGTTTYVGKGYLDALEAVDIVPRYTAVAAEKPLTVVRAANDDVLKSNLSLPGAHMLTIPGDHDFTGDYRAGLIAALRPLL